MDFKLRILLELLILYTLYFAVFFRIFEWTVDFWWICLRRTFRFTHICAYNGERVKKTFFYLCVLTRFDLKEGDYFSYLVRQHCLALLLKAIHQVRLCHKNEHLLLVTVTHLCTNNSCNYEQLDFLQEECYHSQQWYHQYRHLNPNHAHPTTSLIAVSPTIHHLSITHQPLPDLPRLCPARSRRRGQGCVNVTDMSGPKLRPFH